MQNSTLFRRAAALLLTAALVTRVSFAISLMVMGYFLRSLFGGNV